MPELFDLLMKWWKQMLAVMITALVIAGLIVFLQAPQYLSIATAVPASAYSADRSRIFNENVDGLYSNLGSPEDLDMMLGTARLDTLYLAITDQFNLFDHYKIPADEEAPRLKAARKLKKYSSIIKGDFGELRVKVWDTDKKLAPQLANALLDKIQAIHRDLQSAGNVTTLNGLRESRVKLQLQADSLNEETKKAALTGRIAQYDKLIGEYQLMVDSKPPVLLVVERASASLKPDRPRKAEILLGTFVLSFLFALLTAGVLNKRQTAHS